MCAHGVLRKDQRAGAHSDRTCSCTSPKPFMCIYRCPEVREALLRYFSSAVHRLFVLENRRPPPFPTSRSRPIFKASRPRKAIDRQFPPLLLFLSPPAATASGSEGGRTAASNTQQQYDDGEEHVHRNQTATDESEAQVLRGFYRATVGRTWVRLCDLMG